MARRQLFLTYKNEKNLLFKLETVVIYFYGEMPALIFESICTKYMYLE